MNKEELREYCRVASKQIVTLEEKNKKLQQEKQQLKEQLETSEKDNKGLRVDLNFYKCSSNRLFGENKKLNDKLKASEKARKEAITYIKNNLGRKCYFDKEENRYKTNESKVLDILDIDKGAISNEY